MLETAATTPSRPFVVTVEAGITCPSLHRTPRPALALGRIQRLSLGGATARRGALKPTDLYNASERGFQLRGRRRLDRGLRTACCDGGHTARRQEAYIKKFC